MKTAAETSVSAAAPVLARHEEHKPGDTFKLFDPEGTRCWHKRSKSFPD
jgi:hypothetical protein